MWKKANMLNYKLSPFMVVFSNKNPYVLPKFSTIFCSSTAVTSLALKWS